MAWRSFKQKWRRFHRNLLASLATQVITLMLRSTLAQEARHFCARFTGITTLVVPADLRAAVAILGNESLVPERDAETLSEPQ